MLSKKEKSKRYREKRIAEGKCISCGSQKPVEGIKTCQACIDRGKLYVQETLDKGLCVLCRKKRECKEIMRCNNCTRKAREHARNAYRKKRNIPLFLPVEKKRHIGD